MTQLQVFQQIMEEPNSSSPPLSSRSVPGPSTLVLVLENLKKELQSLVFHLHLAPRHRKALKKDPVAHEEGLLHRKKADMKYRAKQKDYVVWKQQVSNGPRNYEVEWVIYQDKRREELQRRVAGAQLKEEVVMVEMVEMGEIYYDTYYCTPPFYHDPNLPAHSTQMFYLVASPQAKVPEPGVYPSWSSTQRVAEGIPHGGAVCFKSYNACLPAWHAGCDLVSTTTQPTPKDLAHRNLRLPRLCHAPLKGRPNLRPPPNHGQSVGPPPHRLLCEALPQPAVPSDPFEAHLEALHVLHYIVRGSGVVHSTLNAALAKYTNLYSSTGDATLFTTTNACHAAHVAAGQSISQAKDLATAERAAAQVEAMGPTPDHHVTFYSRAALTLSLSAAWHLLTALEQEDVEVQYNVQLGRHANAAKDDTPQSSTSIQSVSAPASPTAPRRSFRNKSADDSVTAAPKSAPRPRSADASRSRPRHKSDVAGGTTSPSKLQIDLEWEGAQAPNKKFGPPPRMARGRPRQTGRVLSNPLQLQLSRPTYTPPGSPPVMPALLSPPRDEEDENKDEDENKEEDANKAPPIEVLPNPLPSPPPADDDPELNTDELKSGARTPATALRSHSHSPSTDSAVPPPHSPIVFGPPNQTLGGTVNTLPIAPPLKPLHDTAPIVPLRDAPSINPPCNATPIIPSRDALHPSSLCATPLPSTLLCNAAPVVPSHDAAPIVPPRDAFLVATPCPPFLLVMPHLSFLHGTLHPLFLHPMLHLRSPQVTLCLSSLPAMLFLHATPHPSSLRVTPRLKMMAARMTHLRRMGWTSTLTEERDKDGEKQNAAAVDPMGACNLGTHASHHPDKSGQPARMPKEKEKRSGAEEATAALMQEQLKSRCQGLKEAIQRLHGHVKEEVEEMTQTFKLSKAEVRGVIMSATKMKKPKAYHEFNAKVWNHCQQHNEGKPKGERIDMIQSCAIEELNQLKTDWMVKEANKKAGTRKTNAEAAKDVMLTGDRIFEELLLLEKRTGTHGFCVIAGTHENNTIRSTVVGSVESVKFLPDVLRMDAVSFANRYSSWVRFDDTDTKEAKLAKGPRKKNYVTSMLRKKLMEITGKPTLNVEYVRYNKIMRAKEGVEIVGWLDMPMMAPSKMGVGGTAAIDNLYERLKAGTCYWWRVNPQVREELLVKYAGNVKKQVKRRKSVKGKGREVESKAEESKEEEEAPPPKRKKKRVRAASDNEEEAPPKKKAKVRKGKKCAVEEEEEEEEEEEVPKRKRKKAVAEAEDEEEDAPPKKKAKKKAAQGEEGVETVENPKKKGKGKVADKGKAKEKQSAIEEPTTFKRSVLRHRRPPAGRSVSVVPSDADHSDADTAAPSTSTSTAAAAATASTSKSAADKRWDKIRVSDEVVTASRVAPEKMKRMIAAGHEASTIAPPKPKPKAKTTKSLKEIEEDAYGTSREE
ncbi:hypothetical protein B0H17DRAFT_1142252 [Mycena rosella]|uniref:Uncharacterized protein n=1 Tax=Mycena rosella TaxID=1033263 RepID=A0AAD7G881_MYCRO|nr:hypothetical protein B0H17DRAFT_1142252 [Mycena rosella]